MVEVASKQGCGQAVRMSVRSVPARLVHSFIKFTGGDRLALKCSKFEAPTDIQTRAAVSRNGDFVVWSRTS
jgi:hypothetical protein